MIEHRDDWLKAYVPELPSFAELDAGGAALAAEIEQWNTDAIAQRQQALDRAAAPRRLVTGLEAVELYMQEIRLDRPPAIYTGWHDLDAHLGRPITAGELIVLAARPGVGKTWAIQAWIEKTLASDVNAAAALLEMEMLAWHLGERLTAHALNLSPKDAGARARADLTLEEVEHGMPALSRISIHPRQLSVAELPAALEAAHERLGIRPTILAIDYMGLLGWDGSPGATTYQRASDNARRLKDVALEQNVVILAASQLSRAAGTGTSKPTLDALRDSGVIEEASDRILGLWRDEPIEDENGAGDGELNVCVLKNRHGRSSGQDFPLRFDASMRLVEPGAEVQEEFPF